MKKGKKEEVMNIGKKEKNYMVGEMYIDKGKMLYRLDMRKNNGLFRELLNMLDNKYEVIGVKNMYVVEDKYCINKDKDVEKWLEKNISFKLIW